MFTRGGYIRADGVMIHDMYVMQVKSPQESKYPWDYYKVVKVMSGEEAFGPITGLCPLAPSSSGRAVRASLSSLDNDR
jgi:branched-chain amino acid transport system substrate-binding protein